MENAIQDTATALAKAYEERDIDHIDHLLTLVDAFRAAIGDFAANASNKDWAEFATMLYNCIYIGQDDDVQ